MATPSERAEALVIFGATGDLAKLQTFPALVGLVERGVLDVPVIGIAKSGWDLDQFRGYATDSLRHNGIDPAAPAARMLGSLRYIDGDLTARPTYDRMAMELGRARGCCSISRSRLRCSARSPRGSPRPGTHPFRG